MTYVPPSVVLERLSTFTAETVIDAIGEDSGFARAQVGSMSSTLGFLSREVERRDGAVLERRNGLLDALEDLEELGGQDATAFVAEQRQRVEAVDPVIGNTEEVRTVLREVLGELRRAVEDGIFEPDTPAARRQLYDLFDRRVQSQLSVLREEE